MDVCPSGWRLPSDEDYSNLEYYLGMSWSEAFEGIGYRESGSVGAKMKEPGTRYWNTEECGDASCNSSGFKALPAGFRSNGTYF